MRLWSWTGAWSLLPVLVLLAVPRGIADQQPPNGRHYYIAAVEIDWNYSGNDPHSSDPTYKKVVFREYDKDFRQAKTHPSWLGLLGPTLRAQEGETIIVTFRNMATRPHSIHPHGVAYGKQSEGANYFDNTSQKEKEDDVVQPNDEHVYYWEVTSDVSPQPDDPSCLTYTYISHIDVVEDYNSGLIGTILVCKKGSLNESGLQVGVHQEYVFLFGVFDEKASKYKPAREDNHVKHTINGYTMGSLPDVSLCAHAPVSLHLVGMSSDAEIFSVHINGQVLQQNRHKVSSVGLISGSTATANMVALHLGRWLLSSQTTGHVEAGMYGFVDVKTCDGFSAPNRRMTVAQKRESRVWTYYIAAEEIMWDYAPQMPEHIDEDFKYQYLRQSSTRIGGTYKKAVYTLYKNASFTERFEESKQRKKEIGILGPVIRAQIRDVINIVFKNMASRPYSIYPHGLTIEKQEEGVNYPGNHSLGVQPGETHTYKWNVVDEDEPFKEDSRCLTRLYHSAVDTQRDIASGLIGQILICKGLSLNKRGVQRKADKEQHAMFAVFDENKSWYLEDNIRQFCDPSKVNRADPDFYKSNVMHSINGYVYESGLVLGFCNGEVATWHVSSIGAQDYVQTVTFYGHRFELNGRTEDFLSLYPMTGETITMTMDNIGFWLMASLNSHETRKGMRVKFQDVECYRENQYEYNDDDDPIPNMDIIVWKTVESSNPNKKKEDEPKPDKKTTEIDIYTDLFADELGLRSHKINSSKSDMEKLDLSFIDYDVVDVPDEDMNNNLDFKKTKNKSLNYIPKPNELNETLFSNLTEVDKLNLTAVNLLNQSISENTMHVQNNTTPSTFGNSTVNKTENTTILYSPYILPKNDSITANSSVSVVSNIDNATVSDTKNISTHNAIVSPVVGNVSKENTNLTVTLQKTDNLTETSRGNTSSFMEPEGLNVTPTGENQTSLGTTLAEDSKERLTRGDVFLYSATLSNTSTNNHSTAEGNAISLSHWANEMDENITAAHHVNVSAGEINRPSSIPDVGEVNISSIDRSNLTILEVEVGSTDNKTSDKDSLFAEAAPEYFGSSEVRINSSDVVAFPANSSLENVTDAILESGPSHNVTANASGPNSSEEISSERRENITSLLGELNRTSSAENSFNETNQSLSSDAAGKRDPEELSPPESIEEVYIYLSENKTEVIKTTSVKTQGHNWTYEGTHQTEIVEISDDMMKYFGQTKPTPKKKTRLVTHRQWPNKGQGMKTKKRKEYKPQIMKGSAFSPRGFNPGMAPRGARPSPPQPVSDEAALLNTPVVIGVPRFEFSDYELYIPGDEPRHLENLDEDDYETVNYKDPYRNYEDIKNLNLDDAAKHYLKLSGPNVKTYFIAAEEIEWDYSSYGQRRPYNQEPDSRVTKFTKAVFRGYIDSSFKTPDIRGELDEHLGILGPVIRAEVGESIMVVFKNLAKRPYSLHPNGVKYGKQSEGLSYEDGSHYWFKYDNEVQPNTSFTYIWKIPSSVGPLPGESHCRTWAYYSGVNPERDIHSGLIGPLLVCREGTLDRKEPDMREFMMLFMTFDESQSWYYKANQEMMLRKSWRRAVDHSQKDQLKFHSINGIIFGLKGLRMYTNKLVCWHLINMGSPKDFQSIHFHGQTFVHKKINSYRQAVFPLLPGSFSTLEMYPSKPGLWQLETEVGFSQKQGMQTLFLVLDNDCYRPLGLESGIMKDDQITANNKRGYWEPHYARLNNQGKYNAWSTDQSDSWIQVDLQRPVVLSQVATQGAKQMLSSQYVEKYYISYSSDRRKWAFFKGDSKNFRKEFSGNRDAYNANINTLFPPVVGRFVRLHPISWHNTATVRMELYGCELDGCSVPLGMESRLIKDHQITASSSASSWYFGPWRPSLARLNQQGTVNAWQAKYNDRNQWLQVELPQIKKITGIITQGAKSMGKEQYVMSYFLQYSANGIHWNQYTDDESLSVKTFLGNTNNNDHVKNYIHPPIFSRFIRIVPESWWNSLTMRIELLGCDFE